MDEGRTNKYDKSRYSDNEPTSATKAVKKEWKRFEKYNACRYIPVMEPTQVLGAYDDNS